ncbi:AraC family transcriptional regulator [Blastococcus xanthinilyticus]|uniref:AraC family transcriptional regulator n=1 Tax=Blastococcus xanthinilyticus TaxID=1564164 RepID=A0A5S5CZN2_9ACTN|nr:AraC family transcriptional regulator [Blastococcus xanthinilyticus]TYP88995.1 AraC family transcriptional regulator [Blastococcus xanthinilyticus]
MTVLFDTARVPERERADALQAAFTVESPQHVALLGDSRVHHRTEVVELGSGLRLRRETGSPLGIVRNDRHVRQAAPEVLALGLQRRGEARVRTDESESVPRVGQLDCVDTTRPYEFTQRGLSVRDVLMISHQEAGVSVDTVRAAGPVLARSPVYELVRGHLAGLFAATAQLPPQPRQLTGQGTAALVRTLLLTAAGGADGYEALADSLEVRVRAYVDAHLADRELSVERIAAAHHVSVRHLYAVWGRAGHDRTPGQWIIDRRLHRAREHLASGTPSGIAAVAQRCGFADASHFSRRFRQAFGASPAEWRAAHAVGAGGPAAAPVQGASAGGPAAGGA